MSYADAFILVILFPEFAAERRHLLEYALPELQRHYLQRGIEVRRSRPVFEFSDFMELVHKISI